MHGICAEFARNMAGLQKIIIQLLFICSKKTFESDLNWQTQDHRQLLHSCILPTELSCLTMTHEGTFITGSLITQLQTIESGCSPSTVLWVLSPFSSCYMVSPSLCYPAGSMRGKQVKTQTMQTAQSK